MPTRPKKKCTDCGDVHLCRAIVAGSKRDDERKAAESGEKKKPDDKKKPAAAPAKSRSFLDRLVNGDDEEDDL